MNQEYKICAFFDENGKVLNDVILSFLTSFLENDICFSSKDIYHESL